MNGQRLADFEEFTDKFCTRLKTIVGKTFKDGTPVRERAEDVAPLYWENDELRPKGAEACADDYLRTTPHENQPRTTIIAEPVMELQWLGTVLQQRWAVRSYIGGHQSGIRYEWRDVPKS